MSPDAGGRTDLHELLPFRFRRELRELRLGFGLMMLLLSCVPVVGRWLSPVVPAVGHPPNVSFHATVRRHPVFTFWVYTRTARVWRNNILFKILYGCGIIIMQRGGISVWTEAGDKVGRRKSRGYIEVTEKKFRGGEGGGGVNICIIILK